MKLKNINKNKLTFFICNNFLMVSTFRYFLFNFFLFTDWLISILHFRRLLPAFPAKIPPRVLALHSRRFPDLDTGILVVFPALFACRLLGVFGGIFAASGFSHLFVRQLGGVLGKNKTEFTVNITSYTKKNLLEYYFCKDFLEHSRQRR